MDNKINLSEDDELLNMLTKNNIINEMLIKDDELKEIKESFLNKIKSSEKYKSLIKNLYEINEFVKFDDSFKPEENKYYVVYPPTKSGIIIDDINNVRSMRKFNPLPMQLVANNQKQRLVIPYANLYKLDNKQEDEEKINKDLEIIKEVMIKLCNIKKESIKVINNIINDIILSTYDYYVNNSNEQKIIIKDIIIELLKNKKYQIIDSIQTGMDNSKYSEYFCKYTMHDAEAINPEYSYFNKDRLMITISPQLFDKIKPVQIIINNITNNITGDNNNIVVGNNNNIKEIIYPNEDVKNFIKNIKDKKPSWYKECEEIPLSIIRKHFNQFTNDKYKKNNNLLSSLGNSLGSKRLSKSIRYILLKKINEL